MLVVGVAVMCGSAGGVMAAPCTPSISFSSVGLAVARNFNSCDVVFNDIPPIWGGLYKVQGTHLDYQPPVGIVDDGTFRNPKPDDPVGTANASYGFTFDSSTGTYTIRLLEILNPVATSDTIVLYSHDAGGAPHDGSVVRATQTNTISVTLPNAFPTISSVSPTTGSPTGGTSVTITGTGFTGATSVKFGSASATSFTVDSATQITAVAPAGAAGPADIVVTTGSGTATLASGFNYLVVPPGAPTIGAVTPLDPEAAYVYFTPPADTGGGTITEYVVTSSPHGKTGVGTESPILVPGLWNGTSYTFTVRAKNAAGAGPASAASQAVTPKSYHFIAFNPGPQTFGTTPILSATNTSGMPVVFSSTTPDICTVTSYGELTFHSAGTCTINADAEGNEAYHPAQVTRSFAVNPALPGAPTIGTVTPLDPEAAYVYFTPPADTGGGAITEYVVTSSPHGKTGVGTESPILVPGLWNGTSYTFTVRAKNAAGAGPASAASQAVTPKSYHFIAFNPGPQIFGTTPILSATNTSGMPVVFSSTTPDICTVTSYGELTFHSAGTCTINADAEGNEAYHPAQVTRSFAVNPALPGAPTIGAATAGDTQADVSFIAPAYTGGAPVTYTVTANPGGATGTGASSPVTVAGLTNGVAYTFTVTATNAAGTGGASAASNSITPAAAQTITFVNPGAQSFGTTPILTATSDSGLLPTFTSSTEDVCTITSTGQLTFASVGNCTINANQQGNAAYLPAAEVSHSFVVNAVVPSAPQIGSATAGDTQATITFTAPTSDGGATVLDYTVTVNPGGATFTGPSSPITATALTNGTAYTFTVAATTAAGTGAPSAASNAVTPVAAQFITFANPGSQTVETVSTLTATTSSGLTPVFTSSTPGVCAITGSATLTPVAVGTCTISVDQPGNAAYLAAPTVTQSFAINPPLPTAGNVSATVAANSTANPVTLSLSGGAADSVAVTAAPSHGTATASGTAISYAPDPGYSGADSFTYTATNATGTSAPATVTVTVGAPTFAFTPAAGALDAGTVGRAYSQSISAANGTAPYRYAISTGALPSGLHFDTSSGAITGTPTTDGTYGFAISATDANGATGSATYTLAIGRQVPVVGNVSVTVAANSTANPVTLSLSGGAADSVAVTAAPSHGTATASGTAISYAPDPGYSGADSFTYTAANATGTSAPATVTVTVGAPTFAFTPAAGALDAGTVGRAYSQSVSVANGTAPYRYAVSTDALPSGLHFDASSGAITGTPTTDGTYGFTITATDANGATGSAAYTVAIGRQIPVVGNVSATVAANSTANPVTLSLSGGAADSVAVVAAASHGTATASGMTISYAPDPGYSGADSFTYTAANATGTSAPAMVKITIVAPKLIFSPAGGDLPDAMAGETYSAKVTAKGGQGGILYSHSRGELPIGMILNVSTGELTGPLPADTEVKTYSFTITARDAMGDTGEASYRLAVKARGVTVVSRSYTLKEGDTPRNVYLNTGATGGPFTGAGIAFVRPSTAGRAEIVEGELAASGDFVPVGYYLKFTPNPGFFGTAVVGYRLESALGASNTGTISYAIVHNGEKVAAEIDGLVRDFVRTRQNLLSTAIDVPGLISRREMGRVGSDPISTSMSPSEDGMTLGFSTSLAQLRATEEVGEGGEGVAAMSPFNIWIDGTLAVHKRDENGGRWGSFGLISAGADYLLSEKALIGLSFHFDRMTDPTDADAELTGIGWLAGPYASFEIGSGVFLDTSLLYGGSRNDVDTEYFDGSFDTRRVMWDTKLQGQWQLGDATVLTPALRAVFLNENVDDYSVSNGDGTKVDLHGFTQDQLRLSVGAELERAYRLESGLLLTPRFGGTAGFAALDNSGAFGTVSAGLNLSNELNWDFDFSLLYGIESEGEQTVGAKVGAHVRF
ncbi:putative Ig domain-containing protein [Ensifer sp. MJa1]|uniref:putative Ig domain-containing protein n=1 Tax=Ensifer sp. MJa1 TaxID=2919888 RepID=UPI00300A57C4